MNTTVSAGDWSNPYIEPERVGDAPPASRAQHFLREHWQISVGVGLSLAGAVIVLLGWYGSAHTTVLQYQLPYLISGGMLGSALIVLGGIYSFAHLLSRNQSRLEQLLFEAIYAAESDREPSVTRPPAVDAAARAVPTAAYRIDAPVASTVAGLSRVRWVRSGSSFHDPACQMVTGKQSTEGSVEEARAIGLAPCRICGAGSAPG